MTPSYLVRLLLLSSASFFIVQIALAALVAWLAPAAIRRANRMRPERGARFLLTLRLLPSAFAALIVAALCVPSYLAFEPRIAGEEEAGVVCVVIAIAGALFGGLGMFRAMNALVRSARYVRSCNGRESRVGEQTVWVVPQDAGVALAGILHPRLLISQRAFRELSADELAVALRHEQSHRASKDNLKRLSILLVPAIFPGQRTLERAWATCAEWAADDRAAAGDPDRAMALAEALVRVARWQSGIAMPPLVTSLIESNDGLTLRVDRLLQAAPVNDSPLGIGALGLSGSLLLVTALAFNPSALRIVHRMLEALLD